MLLETTKTTKTLVEVSFPLFAKDDSYNRLYYVSKRKDIISLTVWPVSGNIDIQILPFKADPFSASQVTLKSIAALPNIRPNDFWVILDKALQCLQETVYIDRGNLFK